MQCGVLQGTPLFLDIAIECVAEADAAVLGVERVAFVAVDVVVVVAAGAAVALRELDMDFGVVDSTANAAAAPLVFFLVGAEIDFVVAVLPEQSGAVTADVDAALVERPLRMAESLPPRNTRWGG